MPTPRSPLRRELAGLLANIRATDDSLTGIEQDFWRNGGSCCPGCGVRGYTDLCDQQRDRAKRVRQLHAKLARDGATVEPLPRWFSVDF